MLVASVEQGKWEARLRLFLSTIFTIVITGITPCLAVSQPRTIVHMFQMRECTTELENCQLVIHALDGILRELDDASLHLAAVKIAEARDILMKIKGAGDISSS